MALRKTETMASHRPKVHAASQISSGTVTAAIPRVQGPVCVGMSGEDSSFTWHLLQPVCVSYLVEDYLQFVIFEVK